jgi:hypothetical protein
VRCLRSVPPAKSPILRLRIILSRVSLPLSA